MKRVQTLWGAVVLAVFVASVLLVVIGLQPTPSVPPTHGSPTGSAGTAAQVPHPLHTPIPDASAEPPRKFTEVDKDLATAVAKAGAKGAPAVFLADAAARDDPRFQALATSLTRHGESVFSGALNQSQLSTIQGVAGLKISSDSTVTSADTVEGQSSSFSILQDDATTIPQVDPQLAPTRTQLGLQGTNQVIAIVDTGVDSNALGLGGKVVYRQDFSTPTSACTDNGFLDPAGHGTHVASIAAGAVTSANPAISGVAPSASIIDLRVFNCNFAADQSNVDSALQWILTNHTARNISVVNLSLVVHTPVLDGTDTTSVLVNRLVAAGVFVSVGAGNAGDDSGTVGSPATARYAISVGSAGVTSYGSFLSPFSSQGPTATGTGVDFLAAGSSIMAAKSTANGWSGDTTVYSGTSMAAPYVAGLAALLHQKNASHAPTGTQCSIGPSCAEGVVVGSVTDNLENDISASDWFGAGADAASGFGLVSATNSLKGLATAAAQNLHVTLSGTAPNFVQVPAHSTGFTMTMLLNSSIKTVSGAGTLEYTWLDSQGNSSAVQFPCTLQITYSSSCSWAPAGFTWRDYTFYVPPSSQTMWLRLTSDTQMGADITMPGLSSAASFNVGIGTSDVALDGSGNATVTLTRLVDDFSASVVSVVPTGGITAPTTVNLPGGSAGTNTTFVVSSADPGNPLPQQSGRLTLSVGGTLVGLVSVGDNPAFPAQPGRINVDGKQLTSGDLVSTILRMSSNGTVLADSSLPSLARAPANGFGTVPGPFVVDAGSNTAVKVPITQTVISPIATSNLSGDGSKLVLGEWGTGSGIVPGDTDNRYVWFVHDRTSNVDTEIGGPTKQPIFLPVISENGSDVAFFAMDGSDFVLYWQGGTNYSTIQEVARFTSLSNPTITGVSDTNVLLEHWVDYQYVITLYPASGGSGTFITDAHQPASALSPDGSAVSYFDLDNNFWCYRIATQETIPFDAGGDYPTRPSAPGNDCSQIIDTFEYAPASPHNGSTGMKLVKLLPDGSRVTLALSLPTADAFSWIYDSTASAFLTSTGYQLEPGDTNGLNDLYRGIHGSLIFTTAPVPTISGTGVAGAVAMGASLTASAGTWVPTPDVLTYQWKRNGSAIPGATTSTYVPTIADVGFALTVTVTGARNSYISSSTTSVATAPVTETGLPMQFAVPTISGPGDVWSNLHANSGSWGPGAIALTYQWLRSGVPIVGATSADYSVQPPDAGLPLSVTVTGTRHGYTTTSKTSATKTIKLQLSLTPVPTVTGLPQIGQTLTGDPGTWQPAPVTLGYQWYRSAIPIVGATALTYTVTNADAGTTLALAVTGAKSGYSSVSQFSVVVPIGALLTAAPTPTITGSNTVGSTLTALSNSWAPAPVALGYQWTRDGTNISGANGSTYQLVNADAGTSVAVTVTGTKSGYSSLSRTSAALPIKNLFALTPVPTISGLGRVGQILTATPGAWSPAPATFAYQWTRNGSAIVGATSPTYVVSVADVASTITVVVTGSKSGYSSASIPSAPDLMESVLTPATPAITGSHAIGGTLTAVPGSWAPGGVAFAYQWNRGGTPISGATNSTYTSVAVDGSQSITVTVTGTLDGYTPASATSDFVVVTRPHLSAPIPTISHPAIVLVGTKVSAGVQNWGPSPITLTYMWYRDGVAIAGARSVSYALAGADFGHALTVLVTGSKQGYTTVQMSSFPLGIH